MINTSGFLSVIDHGITVHWEDGPTLHKMVAQVRYRLSVDEDSPVENLRVGASQRCADWDADAEEAQCFMAANADINAQWLWRKVGAGWTAMLVIRNSGEGDIFVDGLDIILIDAQRNGLFRLGATPDMWQIHHATQELIVQPERVDHRHPPAVMFRALSDTAVLTIMDEATDSDAPTEIANATVAMKMMIHEDRFAKFDVIAEAIGTVLSPQAEIQSCKVWVVAGDDVAELRQLTPPEQPPISNE